MQTDTRGGADMGSVMNERPFKQKLSFLKTLMLELCVVTIAALPLTPHFSDGLRYTALFYRWPFFYFLLAACGLLFTCFILILPLLWIALLGKTALEISDHHIVTYGLFRRSVEISRIDPIGPSRLGSVLIRQGGKPIISLPLFLYRNPRSIRDMLDKIKFS